MRKKLPKKKGNWKRAIAISAVALTTSGALWFITGADGIRIPVPSYRAMRVIDGDTFETNERQLIRLTGIDAPELDNCRCFAESSSKGRAGAEKLGFAETSSNFFENQLTSRIRNGEFVCERDRGVVRKICNSFECVIDGTTPIECNESWKAYLARTYQSISRQS